MKMNVAPREVDNFSKILPISNAGFDELVKVFYKAFVDSVEYCNYKKSEVKNLAEIEIENFLKAGAAKRN